MDGFTFHDIYQTKGVEYLVIIAFLIVLIPFWLIINKKVQISAKLRSALGAMSLGSIRIPEGVFFGNNHTWAFLEKSGKAQVGVDDMLMHVTGNVSIKPLYMPGDMLSKGDPMAEIFQEGKVLKVFAPISGEVMAVNAPSDIDEASADPYSEGWIYRLEPKAWKAETAGFYLGREARLWFQAELERFKDFIARSMVKNAPANAMLVLQEGGEVADHALESMNARVWEDFQKEFLE